MLFFKTGSFSLGKMFPISQLILQKLFIIVIDTIMFLLTERRLISTNRLIERRPQPYFMHGLMDRRYVVEDDHIPFLERSKNCSK